MSWPFSYVYYPYYAGRGGPGATLRPSKSWDAILSLPVSWRRPTVVKSENRTSFMWDGLLRAGLEQSSTCLPQSTVLKCMRHLSWTEVCLHLSFLSFVRSRSHLYVASSFSFSDANTLSTHYHTLWLPKSKPMYERGSVEVAFHCPCVASYNHDLCPQPSSYVQI